MYCSDGKAEMTTEAPHETIVETNLEEAEGGYAGHARKQRPAAKFHHLAGQCQREEMKAKVAGTMKAAAQR
jgi:hypothetical protein